MWTGNRPAICIVSLLLAAFLCSPAAADQKPDRKRSEAAMLRAKRAAAAHRSEEALAAYMEAVAADASNVLVALKIWCPPVSVSAAAALSLLESLKVCKS